MRVANVTIVRVIYASRGVFIMNNENKEGLYVILLILAIILWVLPLPLLFLGFSFYAFLPWIAMYYVIEYMNTLR